MATENTDCVAADAHAGSRDKSVVNRVANRGVGRTRAFRTHVALGSEAGQQVGLGVQRGHDHPPGYGLSHGLQIFVSGMEEEMHVGVDQARHQGCIAEIDGLRAPGVGDRGADGNDLVSFNQHLSWGQDAATLDIEQARGMENHGVRGCGSLCQQARPERDTGGEPEHQIYDSGGYGSGANLVVSLINGQDGLQDIRRGSVHDGPYYYGPTMRLRRKIREVTYDFEDLRDLLAKASPYRSGDALAGIAAESGEQRAAAQMTLADLPLRAFLQQALIPYENDEVTRLIIDTHDAAAFAPIAALTVGELRDWLLSDAARGEALAAVAPGLTPEMAAAVSKLMRVQDLILVARKIRVVTQFRTTVGLPGRLSTRLQPNHPVDDPAGIAAAMVDGLLLGSGDAVIGINPASDNVHSVKTLLQLIDHVRQKYRIPVQSCVLAHVSTLMAALEQNAPVDLVFQSIAGTEAANHSFGINLALLDEACAAARELKRGAAFAGHNGHPPTLGDNVMYFETGQGSALSADAHHGVDQQTCEARAYAVARRYRPMLVNTVVGFIGPEYLYDGKQIIRAGLEDHFCGKLLGLPMGCDVCYTNHAEADQDDMDVLLTLLGAAGVNYIMGVPGADDVMLHYQSTSFHDALYLRRTMGLRPAPEFEAWLNSDARLRLSVPAFLT
jgi:ethanolamine ammonia-lyase large subunit